MNIYNILVLVFFTVFQISHYATALNILVITSLPFRSHYMAFQRLFEELALRGHSVTVMNNFPQDKPQNLSFLDLSPNRPRLKPMPSMAEYDTFDLKYVHLKNFNLHITWDPNLIKDDCENLFTNENVKSFREKGEKIDVIFVEQFLSDCGLAYAAVMFDAPIIGITSQTLLPWTYLRLGIPFDSGSGVFYFSYAGQNPPLSNRIANFVMHNVMVSIGRWYVQRNLYKVFNKYLPDSGIDVEKIANDRIKMVFAYQHHSITGARLASPQLLEIGGAHIRKPKPVPKDIENFLSDAKHGAIYISFGSNLQMNSMSKKKMQQFLDAFKKIPQKVIWKLENVTLPQGYDNVYVQSWMPQLDILCHPKILAFISHGGMLSLSETAHCGKPLLAVPFFGDQFSNAAAAADSGIGITMYYQHLDTASLVAAVEKLTSPGMQESAQRVSKLWHDRPMDVLDSAIYWTEYVARHREAPQSLPSTRSSWFEILLLDVYVVLIGILLILCLFMYVILKVVIILFKLCLIKTKHKKE